MRSRLKRCPTNGDRGPRVSRADSRLPCAACDPSSIRAERPCGPRSASTAQGDSPQGRRAPATSLRSLLPGPEYQSCKSLRRASRPARETLGSGLERRSAETTAGGAREKSRIHGRSSTLNVRFGSSDSLAGRNCFSMTPSILRSTYASISPLEETMSISLVIAESPVGTIAALLMILGRSAGSARHRTIRARGWLCCRDRSTHSGSRRRRLRRDSADGWTQSGRAPLSSARIAQAIAEGIGRPDLRSLLPEAGSMIQRLPTLWASSLPARAKALLGHYTEKFGRAPPEG
jgi:hypothetical protein